MRGLVNKTKLKELLKEKGAGRVSEEAVEELARYLEDVAEELARKAVELARYAKRETVKPEDIKLAVKNV
jgi:histone H3/H4